MTHKTTAELSRAYPTDAGLDIKSSEDTIVPAYTSLLVHTGLHVAIKEGFVGILKSRSGLAMKHGIDVAAGVIDANYRGAFSLGKSTRAISEKFIRELLRDNPAGQDSEMTPFLIIRKTM